MGRELVQFKGKRPGPRTFFIIAASGARPVAQTAKTAATAVTGARNSAGCTRIKARRPLMLTPSPGCRRMASGMTRTVPAGRGAKNCRRRCRRRCSRQFRGRSAAIPRQFRGSSEAKKQIRPKDKKTCRQQHEKPRSIRKDSAVAQCFPQASTAGSICGGWRPSCLKSTFMLRVSLVPIRPGPKKPSLSRTCGKILCPQGTPCEANESRILC